MTQSFGDNYREELAHLPSLYLAVIQRCLFIFIKSVPVLIP